VENLAFHGNSDENSQQGFDHSVAIAGKRDSAFFEALSTMKRTSAAVEETIDENDLDVLVSFVRTGEGGCISTLATGGGLFSVLSLSGLGSR